MNLTYHTLRNILDIGCAEDELRDEEDKCNPKDGLKCLDYFANLDQENYIDLWGILE